MTRSRLLWLLGLALVVALAWSTRYDWRHDTGMVWVRIDRWTGRVVAGRIQPRGQWRAGEWVPFAELAAPTAGTDGHSLATFASRYVPQRPESSADAATKRQ